MKDEIAPPPSETVTISRSEYDEIRRVISTVWDCHNLIRKTVPFILEGKVIDESLRQDYQHFVRDFLS